MSHSSNLAQLFDQIVDYTYHPESACVKACLDYYLADQPDTGSTVETTKTLLTAMRAHEHKRSVIDKFIEEYDLSNEDGIALMCLAESLLRVPDATTMDKLIADKLHKRHWESHLKAAQPYFVKASTWGLALTGKWLNSTLSDFPQTKAWYQSLSHALGDSTLRQAVKAAMTMMANHYVFETSITKAKRKAELNQQLCSFDMLGEGARTQADADRYHQAYLEAIKGLAENQAPSSTHLAHGISVKLSALHPRYETTQKQRVMTELYPRLLSLAVEAKKQGIGLNIDAEESWRLCLCMQLFEKLVQAPELANWQGLGFVLQAYNKRAFWVADWLGQLAKHAQKRIMVRLVKGAYWDTEIKHAQQLGLPGYPVFTQKKHTDIAYAACAKKLIAYGDWLYPQFATHNANSLEQVAALAEGKCEHEFQRLHGMGSILYTHFSTRHPESRTRVYAPIGDHNELLPYLVRRLLENGANNAFVHQAFNKRISIESVTENIFTPTILDASHSFALPLPSDLFLQDRVPRQNSRGYDINEPIFFTSIDTQILQDSANIGTDVDISTPSQEDIQSSFHLAAGAQKKWDAAGGGARAKILTAMADLIEQHCEPLLQLLTHEAGRTIKDGIDEIREAADFCRYYAQLARQHFEHAIPLTSPTGELNALSLHGRGIFVCISPWNFPLAIFVGQVAAALAAGNAVIAKPADQTPKIAKFAASLFETAGLPDNLVTVMCGDATLAKLMLDHPLVAGVAFTGSTATAKSINRQLADKDGPIVPFIAETGGQNAMIVDSTALLEQAADDIIQSAFGSAGQRCSATRVLYVQNDIAEKLLGLLVGACDELSIGYPWHTDTDIGPIIDEAALSKLSNHILTMKETSTLLYAYPKNKMPATGTFFGPHILEIDHQRILEGEVFGPILHVIRFDAKDIDKIVGHIHDSGYGLTLGIHSRMDYRVNELAARANVGNIYINRNTVGAVVGVNPFGGMGLSGTGPKAGGPHYLFQFAIEKTVTNNIAAKGGNPDLLNQT